MILPLSEKGSQKQSALQQKQQNHRKKALVLIIA
jgi:hypothetical protein